MTSVLCQHSECVLISFKVVRNFNEYFIGLRESQIIITVSQEVRGNPDRICCSHDIRTFLIYISSTNCHFLIYTGKSKPWPLFSVDTENTRLHTLRFFNISEASRNTRKQKNPSALSDVSNFMWPTDSQTPHNLGCNIYTDLVYVHFDPYWCSQRRPKVGP